MRRNNALYKRYITALFVPEFKEGAESPSMILLFIDSRRRGGNAADILPQGLFNSAAKKQGVKVDDSCATHTLG